MTNSQVAARIRAVRSVAGLSQKALAERLKDTGVTVNCVRVGNVAIPDDRLPHLPKWLLKVYEIKRKFSLTPEKMAETYVWLAADPTMEAVTGNHCGFYAFPLECMFKRRFHHLHDFLFL